MRYQLGVITYDGVSRVQLVPLDENDFPSGMGEEHDSFEVAAGMLDTSTGGALILDVGGPTGKKSEKPKE